MISVLNLSKRKTTGTLHYDTLVFPCAIGRSGRSAMKREGDGATPIGTWPLLTVYYRPDRVLRPQSVLPVIPLRPHDGWCDDPGDRNYNRPVSLPYPSSAERLWRDDHLYDLLVILDHNLSSRRRGLGSAIFMHTAHPAYEPTEGCIALKEADLRLILSRIARKTSIHISPL